MRAIRGGQFLQRVGLSVVACLLLARPAAAAGENLINAVKQGRRDVVQTLIKQGASVNVAEPDGTTPLHWAVRGADREMVELLIARGANVKAANRYGQTPILLAATNGDALILERLLKAGADANSAAGEGETPLMAAATTGKVDAVRVLLASGADVKATDKWMGETALVRAAGENHAAVVDALLEAGADVNAKAKVMDTPQLPFLLSGGPTMDFQRGGWTPLFYAARDGALDATKRLLKAKPDLNVQDPNGMTALMFAIINGHYDVAAAIVEAGADPNLADDTGMTALFAAVDMSSLSWTFGRPAPIVNDELRPADIVKQLLVHGADPNKGLTRPGRRRNHESPGLNQGPAGTTPLLRAARATDSEVVRLLLEGGANPFITSRDHSTPLMVAAGSDTKRDLPVVAPRVRRPTQKGAIECISLLLAAGSDIEAFNDAGVTALHGAIVRGDDVVKFVAEKGAKLDAKTRQGKTALSMAEDFSKSDSVDANRFTDKGESTINLLRTLMGLPTVPVSKTAGVAAN